MDANMVAAPEVFSALCAEDVSVENRDDVALGQARTTSMSPHDNLVWDD